MIDHFIDIDDTDEPYTNFGAWIIGFIGTLIIGLMAWAVLR